MAENLASGTTVGALSTTDPDVGDTHTYALVSGTGSTDNGFFTIVGSSMRTNAVFNYETKSSYSIRVRTTDSTTRFFEKVFTISVTNVNEAPTFINITNPLVAENQPVGTTVGNFSPVDPDVGDTHTFALVAGTGSTDNSSFTITGTSLQTNAVFNFETKSTYSIRVRVTDAGTLFFEQQLTIFIGNVNEAPTDITLTGLLVPENLPSGSSVGTFITVDPDPLTIHTYTLVPGIGSADNASFSLVGPELKTNAVFDFETKSSYSIRVRATDPGMLFFEKVFTISVGNVNEAPVNTVPGAQSVNEDTDLTFSSGGGNALSVADVDVGGANVQTTVSTLNGTITPMSGSGATVTGSGTSSAQILGTLTQVNAALSGLRYRGTANWNSTRGSTTLTIVTNDLGNTGGAPLSDTDTVAITVNAVNDAPTAATKTFTVQANMMIAGLSGLLTGATDPDTGDGSYTASFTVNDVLVDTCAASSTISNVSAAAGTFDFDPQPGFSGTCTLRYRVNDSGNPGPAATSPYASITLTVNGPVIWFVNAAAAPGGNGRLSSPFQTLAGADAVDAANHRVFVYTGTTPTGLTLNSGEWLIGQSATGPFDTLFAITPPAGTIARPTMGTGTTTIGGTVTLATNARLQGLAISTGASAALAGTGGITGVNVTQTALTTTTGTTLNLNDVAGTLTFSDLDKNGTGTGITMTNVAAAVTVPAAAAIANTTTGAVDIDGGTGAFTFAGVINNSASSGRTVEVTNRNTGTPGAVQFTGSINGAGTGVNLDNNDNGTISFTGGLTLSTGANPAFNAGNGGTVTATDPGGPGISPNNTLTTTNSTALNVSGTTIGAAGLNFLSISASGGTNGIVLNDTGSTAGLTVTGTGTTDGSGGTIQSATRRGADITAASNISLSNMNFTGNGSAQTVPGSDATCGGNLRAGNNLACVGNLHLQGVTNVTLANVNVTNSGQMGINGNNVANFTLSDSTVTGNGNEVFENGLTFQNLTGTSTITNSMIKDNAAYQINVTNIASNSTLTLGITGTRTNNVYPTIDTSTTEIGKTTQTNTSTDQSLLLDSVGTATNVNMTLNVTGVVFRNSLPGNSMLLNPIAATGTFSGTTTDTSFHNTAGGVIIQAQNGMNGTYNVTNSEFNRVNLQSILYGAANPYTGALQGTVSGNHVGEDTTQTAGAACEPSPGNCNGIQVNFIGGSGSISARIQNNRLQQVSGNAILATGNGTASPSVNLNIVNNTIQNPAGLVAHGIGTNMGTTAGANVQGCLGISGNTITGTYEDPGVGVQLRIVTNVRFLSVHRLPGYSGSSTSVGAPPAATAAFINGNNTAGGHVFTQLGGSGTYPGGAACTTP